MRRLLEKLEALMGAVAFAEEGEVEVARQIMAEAEVADPGDRRGKPERPSSSLYPPRAVKASQA